ncbi:hypothetical protein [Aliiglaciecola sp. LCG003]|uniref:hypothetical protein n=1 Tax=Aliiglaciecola sp. LCG003 TaxID=3053655 RepID=UPI002572305A|nr:hypothetical protein [Aliiglaciecola sp. LCG003]WJG10313.1 hypothetical protein QR722_04560 [Aliiglaciecola sp. LCG003]
MKKSLFKYARKIHKWAGWILAIQILFWISGGLVMSAIPLEKVHGKHLAQRVLPSTLQLNDYSYPLDSIVAHVKPNISKIEYAQVLSQPYYLVYTDSQTMAFDGQTGKPLPFLSNQHAAHIAKLHYLGQGIVLSTELLAKAPREAARSKGQVWKVRFDDLWDTTLYISPFTGQLLTIRSDIWRIFDFFWMLHIMDYDDRENFNNPLLISFSGAALVFTLTGILLLFQTVRLRRRKSR